MKFVRLSPQDDVAEADKFLQKWKTLSDVEKAKKKEEDETLELCKWFLGRNHPQNVVSDLALTCICI